MLAVPFSLLEAKIARLLGVVAGNDAVLAKLPPERVRRDAEDVGSLLPVPGALLKDTEDVPALDLRQRKRRLVLIRRDSPAAQQLRRKICGLYLGLALREYHRPLHRMLQLADVAGPRVREESVQSLR